MHNQRIALIISAIIGIIGTFLPYMKSYFYSASLIETKDGTGYIILIAFAISLFVALLGNHKEAITKVHIAGSIIPGIIPAVILLLLALSRQTNDIQSELARTFSNFDIGFYVVIIASLSNFFFGLALKDNGSSLSNISNRITFNSKGETLYCTGCGKIYTSESAGEFCEECGNKL